MKLEVNPNTYTQKPINSYTLDLWVCVEQKFGTEMS